MTQAAKLLQKMRRNPRDWRIEEFETIAGHFGIKVRKPGGSHAVFFHEASGRSLSGPSRKPIKPVYVRAVLAMLDDLGANHDQA